MFYDVMGFSLRYKEEEPFCIRSSLIYGIPRDSNAIQDNFKNYSRLAIRRNFRTIDYYSRKDAFVIVAVIDCYDASWITRYYKKVHVKHLITLFKNPNNDGIYLFDMNFNIVNIYFKFEDINKCIKKVIWRANLRKAGYEADYHHMWLRSKEHLMNSFYLSDIKRFNELFENNVLLDSLYGVVDPVGVPMIGDMIPIIGGRIAYKLFLDRMYVLTGNCEFIKLSKNLQLLINYWNSVYHVMTKACVKPCNVEKKIDILYMLDKICDHERNLIEDCLNIYQ